MDLNKFFQDQNKKKQVKILTCGSVDDGKSTLLGRLLFDSKNIFLDQMDQTKIESEKYGTQGKEIDLALLVDGLQAEREQGITIDVAYRYFETSNCKFIIADTPGHEQYTRNMATGASNSDVAIILIDAEKGVLEQTKRHSFIVNLLGIKHIVVAINKMDLVNYKENIFLDQMDQAKIESEKYGTQGKEIDLALLVDGLQAEREQGITIDVAYRYFETSNCKFIIADTPGHEQYTRNMATGASNSDVAIILIDAQKGVLEQTRRHSFIVNLLGIKHIVVAINKMDLINYNENVFETIVDDYKELIKNFTFTSINFIPLSALKGDNVFSNFENTKWYKGSTLIEA